MLARYSGWIMSGLKLTGSSQERGRIRAPSAYGALAKRTIGALLSPEPGSARLRSSGRLTAPIAALPIAAQLILSTPVRRWIPGLNLTTRSGGQDIFLKQENTHPGPPLLR